MNTVNDINDNFKAEFAASHFTVLAKLRRRVLATADNPEASLFDVDKAITIEIKIANYLHKVKEREERGLKAKQPRVKSEQSAKTPHFEPVPTTSSGSCCQLRI